MTGRKKRKLPIQRGFMLVDTLLGLAILGIFLTTLMGTISTGFIGIKTLEEAAIAENLVRSQLESVKGEVYLSGGGYSVVPAPTGYSVSVAAESITGVDPVAMQQVAVTVSHGNKVVRVMRDFKVNR